MTELASTPDLRLSVAPSQASASRKLRALLYAALSGLLLWLVLTHSLAAYLATAAPSAALWLNPNQPTALMRLAEEQWAELQRATGPDDK